MVNDRKRLMPKILTLDIETSPVIAYTWANNMYETGLIEIIEYGKILSYSGKWLNGTQETKGLIDYKGYKKGKLDDKLICKDIHKLLDDADIVVTQNGVAFDTKYLNSRFVANGMNPPSLFKNIDTYKEAKNLFKIPSHSLNEMSKYFSIGSKMSHEGFDLWKKCMAGDEKSWVKMKKYNAKDVLLTEEFYLKIRPYIKNHPNISAFIEKPNCPKCGKDNIQYRGFQVTTTAKYRRCQCQSCGGWFRDNRSIKLDSKPGVNI